MALSLKIDEVTDCEGKKGRKYTLVCEAAKINKSIMQHSGQLQIRVYLSKWHRLRANVSLHITESQAPDTSTLKLKFNS